MNSNYRVVASVGLMFVMTSLALADVTAERSDRGVVVKIDGELFTEYLTEAGQAPALWPVIGPNGQLMTRSYPVGPTPKGVEETDDHPHHQSIWFTHDQVNGANFWEGNRNDRKAGQGPHIKHRAFKSVRSGGTTAHIVTANDWMDGDKKICEDERGLIFGTLPNGDRWIDFAITIRATDGDVTFGDTKEGTFAVRVADSMRVEAKLGGKIVNSEGQENEAAWGLPAKWVDYTGPVAASLRGADGGVGSRSATDDADGQDEIENSRLGEARPQQVVGIAIFSHPKSFRPTPRWHVRTYGLFTANPFGESDFPKHDKARQGAVTIKKGDLLNLRYLILLHGGATDKASLNKVFDDFAGNALATLSQQSE
jgi:hypothetical protein